MSCTVEVVPIYEEDPCGGNKQDARCLTDTSPYVDLGVEANSSQQDINQAVYNALQASKTTTDELQLQLDNLVKLPYIVNNLPLIATIGDEVIITDATTPTYLGIPIGGGTITCIGWFNGTIWVTK